MDDMEQSNDLENTDGTLEPLSEGIGLPEGIEKNLAKAVWKLSAGLLNIPLQAIERHLAEKKSQSDARITVNQTVAQRISEQLNVPEEYVTLAVAKSFGNIAQEQLNLDSILEKTQQILQNTPQDENHTEKTIEDISDDWLNRFRGSACQKSTEEAQKLFAKVLAGEIRKPGSFSLKALTTLADMDQKVAQLFQTFCSLCLIKLENSKMYLLTQSKSHFKIKDARIPFLTDTVTDVSMLFKNKDKPLSKLAMKSESIYNSFGFNYNIFNLLSEYGLIEASLQTSSYKLYPDFWYNNELWACLKPEVHYPQSPEDFGDVPISGYALTSVGRELFYIIELQSPQQYWELLTNYLQELYSIKLFKYTKPKKKSPPDGSTDSNPTNT